jgi:hypothetical protein
VSIALSAVPTHLTPTQSPFFAIRNHSRLRENLADAQQHGTVVADPT